MTAAAERARDFGLHLASHIAKNHHIPVLFYSWEQTRRVLTARLLAKESGINPTTMLTEDIEGDPEGLVHAPGGPGLGAQIDFDLIERRKLGVLR